mgnify:CR=1 FL=1
MNKFDSMSGESTAAALLESMRVVRQALMQPGSVPSEQLVNRIKEWQCSVTEMMGAPVQGAELAVLYEILGALNSSLDLTQTLDLVMDSLIHLTEAERGCLMLLDEDNNLEIRAAQHFDQESVDASELKLSHTAVQEAMETGEAVLTTNAQLDPRFARQESVVGYNLRSIVCVPLHVRDWVIGALYLDNRIREDVFSEADLPLLMAFANQAAVAIENARLYTMTDQSLAARVEELTTLQHIDQELSASLDLERVLDLTLSRAMESTRSDVGKLSILEEDGRVHAASHAGDEKLLDPEPEVVQQVTTNQESVVLEGRRMLVPIRYEGQTVGVLDLQRDGGASFRPERIKFASQLADHAAIAIENARLYKRVQQADRAKTEFISFVAHELRTPMTSIRGYADMLLEGMFGDLPAQHEQFIQTIHNNVTRMQVLVSDLQDVSRIETGHLKLEIQPADLADALKEALQSTRGQVEARSQDLTLDTPDDLPMVHADPSRLTQILINLLSNAYKYTPEGGSISVRIHLQDEYVHCAVSDTGIGVSPEDQEKLFTKFFRSEDQAVRDMPGTGLGLCITKSLVELQGGQMEVKSQLGEGTTFTFTVPVTEADGDACE